MKPNKQARKYDPSQIEGKWLKVWQEKGVNLTQAVTNSNKKYVLDMFPYPSGASLHVGHVEGYVGTDIITRYERMQGNNVLHPMGWDAFGLPAENYAIKTGIHPDESTHKNIETFKRQLDITGLSYDWNYEIDTSSPEFYKWTQWLFILMFKRGLAYKKLADVNWCPSCETVLANEQVVDGKCDRCETEVVRKKLDQWFLKITDYADKLISGLKDIDWLEEVKVQQKNWIGRSEGVEIAFRLQTTDYGKKESAVDGSQSTVDKIKVFTTRPDTLYGVTFIVIGPDSPLVKELVTKEHETEVSKYVKDNQSDTNLEADKVKTGVFTGSYVINPANNEKIPVWIANYVVSGYGSEAVMGVPAHDQRDFEFASKYNLPIVFVIRPEEEIGESEAYTGGGKLVNSDKWNGIAVPDGIDTVLDSLIEHGWGTRKTAYHLRDWLISRQRYWGAPIPMIYCEACSVNSVGEREDMSGWFTVLERDLPVILPKDVDFKPTGESPIARSKSFQENVVCPNCGGRARREVDTMDSYVCSSWYFIRFADPKNNNEFASLEAIKTWLPVDVYVGGGHVVQHLLYARFFWKVLVDAGLIDESLGYEPFLKLRAPGWILGPDFRKMSKRWSNVITPDEIIPKYGADTLRMYEMFMAPFETMKPWSLTGVEGMWRFINKIWRLFEETINISQNASDREVGVLMAKLIKRVGEDIEEMRFNTAISTMMITYNSLVEMKRTGVKIAWHEVWEKFLLVMAPFAPFLAEELWQKMGSKDKEFVSIHSQEWPKYDPSLIEEKIGALPVQVNGKLRGLFEVSTDEANNQQVIEAKARELATVSKYLEQGVKKVIFVPGKLLNFVV